MGKRRHIDHRRPPKEAGIPRVLRQGKKVAAHPEPESPEEQKRREAQTALEGRAGQLEEQLRVKDIEVQALKQLVIDAREALAANRAKQLEAAAEPAADEPPAPQRINIVTVDDIEKNQSTATLQVLLEADGAVGEAVVTIPVEQLKQIIRQKKRKAQDAQSTAAVEPTSTEKVGRLPELRHAPEGGNIPHEPAVDAEAHGADVPELRASPTEEPTDDSEFTI